MHRRSRSLAVAAVALVGAIAPTSGPVSGAPVRPGSVTGWMPYWLTGNPSSPGTAYRAMGLAADAGLMTEVSPFLFSATGATTIKSLDAAASVKMVVDEARRRGLRVIPSVTDGSGKLAMQAILSDPTTRAAHIDTLVRLAVNGFDYTGTTYDGIAFDGIDLDYEVFAFTDGKDSWAKTQPAWQAFVTELATALHANGKVLSVTVPPMWDDGKAGYWVYFPTGTWAPMMDVVDRLRLMVYDWSVGAPGPIAPMSWVRSVIAFVQKQAPAHVGKVWLGVPQHGRSWARVLSGECPDAPKDSAGNKVSLSTTSVTAVNAPDLAASKAAQIFETMSASKAPEGEKYFTYPLGTFSGNKTSGTPPPPAYDPQGPITEQVVVSDSSALAPAVRVTGTSTRSVTCTVERVVHFPDNDSVLLRAQAAQDAGLGGIMIWAFGYEPLDLWSRLATG